MAWLEVSNPFCEYLKNGKCYITNETIDNPYDKCVNQFLKCKTYRNVENDDSHNQPAERN